MLHIFIRVANERGPFKESAEHKVDLPGDDPVIVKLLIQFLYECEYEPKLPNEFGGRIPLIVPVSRSYHYTFPHTCERTGVCDSSNWRVCNHHRCSESLCGNDCRGFICEKCTGVSDTSSPDDLLLHAKMYEIADKYDVSGLKILSREKFSRSCIKYWDHGVFPIAFEYALSSTPDKDQGLREVLCRTIVAHTTLLDQATTERILSEHSTFAYQLTRQLAAKLEGLRSIG